MSIMRITYRLVLVCSLFFMDSFVFGQQPVKTETYAVYFDTDKHALTPESQQLLAGIARHLDTLKDATLSVSGHTDARASATYNEALSARRIQSVMQFLETHAQKDLPSLEARAAEGETHPAATNDTEEGMSHNRRVELTIQYPQPATAAKMEAPVRKPETIQDLYDQLAPAPVTYCIDNTRDTLLTCEKGTIIHIPAFAFSNAQQQPCTMISVVEALSISDMLLQNLSTMSNKQLLETSGMVTIQAMDTNGKELPLINDKRLTLFFPTDSVKTDFTTFAGSRDTKNPHTVNWTTSDRYYSIGNGPSGIPVNYWINCWNPPAACERCTFLPCRIRRIDEGLRGIFNGDQRQENRDLRECQRSWRKGRFTIPPAACLMLQQQWIQWNIQPDSTLFKTLYKDYMAAHGLKTMQEAIDRMRQEQDSLATIQKQTQILSYNVIQSMQMGMINCDRFTQSGLQLTQVPSTIAPQPQIDGKLIFMDIRSIMPAYNLVADKKTVSGFPNIPIGQQAWALFLKIEDEQPYLFLQQVTAGAAPIDVQFRAVSTDEIKAELARLDQLIQP